MVVAVSAGAGMDFLTAVYCQAWRAAWVSLNGTSTYEMLRLLDQIDRLDLADFAATASSQSSGVGVDRIAFAVSVVKNRRLPAAVPASITGTDRSEATSFLLPPRSPLLIPRDPTHSFPPTSSTAPLTLTDFQSAADELGVEVAAVRAVASVESGNGRGFAADGRAIIRYELHRFHKYTAGHYDTTHPHFVPGLSGGACTRRRATHGVEHALRRHYPARSPGGGYQVHILGRFPGHGRELRALRVRDRGRVRRGHVSFDCRSALRFFEVLSGQEPHSFSDQ